MFRYIAFIVLILLHTNASAAPSWFGANPFSYAGSNDPSGASSTGDLNFSGLKTSFIAPGINDTTSGGWVSTGIQAVSGQAVSFQKDLSKGITINPYVYLVEYRADYRFDYPAVFIYNCNSSGTSCVPDYVNTTITTSNSSSSTTSTNSTSSSNGCVIDWSYCSNGTMLWTVSGLPNDPQKIQISCSCPSTSSSNTDVKNTPTILNNYFAMGSGGIPVYRGDLVNITYPNLTSSMDDIGSVDISTTSSTYINLLELNSKSGYWSDNVMFNMTADEFCRNNTTLIESGNFSTSCVLGPNNLYQYQIQTSTTGTLYNIVGGITPLANYSIPSCNSSAGTYYAFLNPIIGAITTSSNSFYLGAVDNLIRNYLLLGGIFSNIRSTYANLSSKPSSIDQDSYPYLYQLANGSTSTDATLQTAALSTKLTYCLQDKGLGLEIDVGTTIIKDENIPFISFATSGITNYVYSFTSPADGLLGFRNTAKINSGSSYTFNNFDARLSANTSSGVLNTAAYTLNTPKMNGFNFGRYLLEVKVGRGGNYLANVLPNLTYSYYIQRSGGSAPTSSTTGTTVPGFGQFAAPSSGTIWVKVASTDTNISGKAYMKVQSYTGSQVLSKGLNDYVIKPILTQFASVMRLIYDGPTGLVNNSVLIKIVKTAAILYVILFAIYFLFGQIRITVEELVSRIVKITLTVNILFSSQSWTFFNTYLFDTILRGTNYLILVFTGQDATSMTPFTFLDPIFNTYISSAFWGSILAQLPQIWNGLTFIAIITVMGMSVFLTALFEVVMTYVLAFITIYILIGIAPLFIPLMLFSATSQFFYNWIKTLVKSMLVPVVFIVLILTFDTFIHQVLNSTIVSNHWGCLKQFSIHIPLGGKDLTFLENNPGFCLPFYIPNLTSSYNTSSQSLLNNLQTASTTDLQATAMSGAQSLAASVSNNYVSSGANTSGAWSSTVAGVGNSALAILDNTATVITNNVSSLAGTALVGYMTVIRAAFLYFTYAIVAKKLLGVTEEIVGKITGIEANIFHTAVGAMNQEIEKRQSQAQKVAGAAYNKTAGVLSKVGGKLGQGISQGIGFMKNSKFMAVRTLGTALGGINSTVKGATKLATGMGKGLNALGKFVLAKPSYDDDITQRAGRFVKGAVNTVKATAWAAKTTALAVGGAAKTTASAVGGAAKLALGAAAFIPKKIIGAITKRALRDHYLKKYSGDKILKGMSEGEGKKFEVMSDKEKGKFLKKEADAYAKERWSNASASRLLNPIKLADEKRFGKKYKDQFEDRHTAAGRAKYNEARAAYASEKGKERFAQVFSQKARDEKHFMQKYKGLFTKDNLQKDEKLLKELGLSKDDKRLEKFGLHTTEGRAFLKASAAAYAAEKAEGRSVSSLLHGMTRRGKEEAAFLKANKANFKDLHTVEGRAAFRSAAKGDAIKKMEARALTKYIKEFGIDEKMSFASGKAKIREEALAYKQDQRQERSISAKLSKVFTQKGRLAAAFEKENKSQSNQQTIEGRATLREAAKQYAIENTLGRNSRAFFEHNKGSLKERLGSSDMKVRVAAQSELLQAAKSYSAGIRQDRAAEFKKSPIAAMGSWINEKRFGQSFEGSKAALNKKYQNEYMQGLIKDMGQSKAERALFEGKFDPKAQAEARLSKMSPTEIMKEALGDRVKVNQAETSARNQAIKAAASKFVSPLVSAGSYVSAGAFRFGGVLASPVVAAGSYIGRGASRLSSAAGSTLASAGSYAGQKASGLANATMERVFELRGNAYSRKYLTERYETKIKEAYKKEVGEKQYASDLVFGKFVPKAEAEAMLKTMSAQEIRKEASMLGWSQTSQAINKNIAEKRAAVSKYAGGVSKDFARNVSEYKERGVKTLSAGIQNAKVGILVGIQNAKSSILQDANRALVESYKGAVVANKFLDKAVTSEITTGLKLASVLGGFALDAMIGPPPGLTKEQQNARLQKLGGDLYDIFARSAKSEMQSIPGFNPKIGAAALISPLAGAYMLAKANQDKLSPGVMKVLALANPLFGADALYNAKKYGLTTGDKLAIGLSNPVLGIGYLGALGVNKAYTNLTAKGPSSELSRSTPPNNSTKVFQLETESATKLQALARGHLVRGGIRKEIASYIEDTTTRSSQFGGSIRAANEALKGLNQNIDGADAFRRELGIAAQGRDKQSLQELNQLTRDFGKARASFNELSGGQKDNALSALYRKDLHEHGQVMLDATSKYQAAAEHLSNRAQSANEQRLGVFEKYVGNIEGTSKGLVDQIQKDRELQNKLQARYEVLTKSKAGEVDKDTKELTQKVGQLSRNLEEANNRFNALAADYRKTGQNQDKLIEAGREIAKLKESYANDSVLLIKQLEGRTQEAAATKLQALARGRVVRANTDKAARESIVNISARQNEIADFRKALSLDAKAVSQNLSEGRNKQIAERNQEILGKVSAIEGQFKGDKDRFDALSGKQKEGALSAIEKVELGKLRERISQSDATYKSVLEGLKEQSSNLQRLRKEDEYVNRITTSVANARGFKDETADIRKRITEERETLEIFKRGTTVSLDLKTDNWLKNLDKADADLKGARADITKLTELRKQRDLDEGERKSLIQAGLKATAAEKIYKEAASQSKELNQVRARLQEEREGARRNFEIRTKANIASIDERTKRTENKAQGLDSALRGLGRARGEGGAVVRTDETTNALKALNKEQANLHKAQQDFSRLSEAAKTRNLSKEERKQLSTSLDKIDAASKASYKAFDNVHQESARVRDETKSALERAALGKQESFEKGLQAKQQADRREAGQSIKGGIVENRAAALQRSMTSDKLQQVSREGIKAQQVAKEKAESQAKADLEGHKKVFTPLAAAAAEAAQTRAAQVVARADARDVVKDGKVNIAERAEALLGAKEQDQNRQEGAHRQAMSSVLGDIRAKGERIERENEAATKIQGFVRDRAAIDDAKAQLAGLGAEKAAQDALKQTERENTAATKLQAALLGFATREAVSERRTEDIIDRMSSNVDALKIMEKELKKEWGTLENNNLDTTSMRKGVNDLLTQLNNVRGNFDSSLTTYDVLSDKKKDGDLRSSDQKSLIDARKDLQISSKEYNDLLTKFKDQFSEIQGERKKATEKAVKDDESVYKGPSSFAVEPKTIQTRENVPRSVDVITMKAEQKLEPVLTSASLTPNNQAPAKTPVIERTINAIEASAAGYSAPRSASTVPAETSLDLGRVEDQARPVPLTKSRSTILIEANDALGSGRVGNVGEALRKAKDSNDVDKILRATEEGINRYSKLKEMIANVELNEKEQKELKAADDRAKRAGNTVKSVRKGLDPNAKSQDRETKSSAMNKGLLAYENNLEMNKVIEGIIERLARESKKKK